ncbi:MAG TPA: aquaporin [Gemmatimonadaceae bacterium]|nr:aquaporin [Gemmatimonadaceae bacterium]
MKVTYITEAVGTYFLVLTVGLTVLAGTPLAPIAIGSSLMVMVYMGGHISGAHYNPAVTLAVWMRGKLPTRDVIPYWLAQLVGGVLAALTVWVLTGKTFAPAPGPGVGAGRALLVEGLFTFALALVVLNSATSRQTEGNSFYGLAIGFTVLVGAFAGGAISGGAFNPAVGIAPALVDAAFGGSALGHAWLYLVGPLAGGAVAALLFRAQNPEEPEQAIPAAPAQETLAPGGTYTPSLPGERPSRTT